MMLRSFFGKIAWPHKGYERSSRGRENTAQLSRAIFKPECEPLGEGFCCRKHTRNTRVQATKRHASFRQFLGTQSFLRWPFVLVACFRHVCRTHFHPSIGLQAAIPLIPLRSQAVLPHDSSLGPGLMAQAAVARREPHAKLGAAPDPEMPTAAFACNVLLRLSCHLKMHSSCCWGAHSSVSSMQLCRRGWDNCARLNSTSVAHNCTRRPCNIWHKLHQMLLFSDRRPAPVVPRPFCTAAPMTNFSPCFFNMRWKFFWISPSMPGVTLSRNSTTVTSVPRRW